MSISIVCPGCRKRFQVADQFAGRTGPCPSCKHPIKIPAKGEEVQVHTPTEFAGGGRTTTGKLITKPISRRVLRFDMKTAVIIGAASLVVLVLTWLLGANQVFARFPVLIAVGLVLISPPLVLAGYKFVYNEELEPYQGKELYIRAGCCALAYIGVWGAFAHLAHSGVLTEIWMLMIIAPPLIVIGGAAGLAALDLEFGGGCLMYSFYLLLTILLYRIAGMGWVWDIFAAST
jgi:hypothetical protein